MKSFIITTIALLGAISAFAQSNNSVSKPFTIAQADSLYLGGSYKDAIPIYEAVLSKAPDHSLGWNRLAYSYHNTGDYEKALHYYLKSLDHKPVPQLEAAVRARLARVYAVLKQPEKAFTSLEQALSLGYGSFTELENQKDFENIRNDQRFAGLIERARKNAFPCLDVPQAREFDFWLGEWDVYPRGANLIIGRSKIEVASGGCMILENWTAIGPQPHEGKSMNYVNSRTGKWEQYWIGSGGLNQNNPQLFVNGEYRDGAMRFEFEQTDPQGNKQIGRFIFYNEGPDQVRQFNEVSSDGGKTWNTVYDFLYKRRK